MRPEIQTILAELKRRFEAIYGDRLVQMILYGSHARGDAEGDSDIDVLVVLRGRVRVGQEIERTSEVRSQLSLDHDVVISCVYVSADRFTTEQSPLLMNIRREGVPV